jgi:hypothetical protein
MDDDDPESEFWVKSDHNEVVHYGTDILCEDYGEHVGYPREQRLGDAHLSAASKDLYNACDALVTTLLRGVQSEADRKAIREAPAFQDAIKAMEKAQGKK